MDYLLTHYTDILAVIGAVMALASVITGLTDTDADDRVVAAIKGVLARLSFLQPKTSYETLKVPLKKPATRIRGLK